MGKIMQINITCGLGSTGKLSAALYEQVKRDGWEADFCHAVYPAAGIADAFPIETKAQHYLRRGRNKLFGNKIAHSTPGTRRLIRYIEKEKPDLVHLHNVQQNSTDYITLFSYLKEAKIPVVYTLHDCWAFTGGCYHFTERGCTEYRTGCHECPLNRKLDDVTRDAAESWRLKAKLIGENDEMQVVCVSEWLRSVANESYMGKMRRPVRTIRNGIDLETFHPRASEPIRAELGIGADELMILGVSSFWTREKGLSHFEELARRVPFPFRIVLVGDCGETELRDDPHFLFVPKTQDMAHLAQLYSAADVFVNASLEETFSMTTAEAVACGTPAIVFNSTASPEVVDEATGLVIEPNDDALLHAICTVRENGKEHYTRACAERATKCFSQERMLADYTKLYGEMLKGTATPWSE